ncbi:universal stress protein [Legionella israelensis]|uniref:Universal stress protein n=1 Tax=Legionella israelensis TaxID=454 RepID=A0A0W0VGT6_9GAMM|nr:universal stress protein [Legionella israelensis]KTD19381.1 universal stress protein A UspA [Legionella israelensis]QBR84374.1 universal stress protein [Legionella israelensis]QBS08647.1 universal stress protein [Legionella israelensis]SCY10007.1 universal stress protein A [Legionella israelensis DSM 19235]STX58310.1 universal stress protein A UspA [Legionella israelensis]
MYNNILHATDLSEEHFHVSEKAKAIADYFKAKLYLLHVIELPASVQLAQGLGFTELAHPAKDDALTVIELLGEALSIPKEQQIVEIGSVVEHIFRKVKELNCNLIIIGSHTNDNFSTFLGSTASATVHHAPCDVITLRI